MENNERTHWTDAQEEIDDLKKRVAAMSADDRRTELMTEIATQLMWLNAHMSELHSAVHRVADNS